jgi:hypothetical protein
MTPARFCQGKNLIGDGDFLKARMYLMVFAGAPYQERRGDTNGG